MPRLTAALAVSALLSLPALAGTPLEEALAASQDGPLYSFEIAFRNEDTDARIAVDPSRPEGERVTVLSPAEEDWSEAFAARVAEMQANTTGDIWCRKLAENIPDEVQLASETDTTATYTFTPKPGEEPNRMDKAYKHLTGTVVVDKVDPAILHFSMVADKPFKPMPVAKIRSFEMKVDCTRAPDGRTHVSTVDVNLSGSAMMQSFSQADHQKISNLQALPGPVPPSGAGTK